MSFSALFSALSKLSNIYLPLHQCQKHDQTFSPLLLCLPIAAMISVPVNESDAVARGESLIIVDLAK